MKKYYLRAYLFFSLVCIIESVPLENWRLPFYQIAVNQGKVSGSPSGMFWDDLGYIDFMNQSLWPDSINYSLNHWTVEPSLSELISSEKFYSGKISNLHIDILSNFRFQNLTIRTMLDVDQSNKSSPYYIWKKDRIAAGLIEEAYIQYKGKFGFIRLGRLKRNWGPFIDRSILLSNNTYSYNALEWQFYTSFLEFRHLFSAFTNDRSTVDTKKDPTNRYLSAHALNFIIGKWASFGISETVVFSRKEGFPDLQYINPVSIYSVTNTNGEGDANLMIGLQWWFHPLIKDITVKGQMVFDDFQVDDKTIADQEPTHWAGDFGIYWTNPTLIKFDHNVSIEYRYLSKWIYTVNDQCTFRGQRYSYLGRSLGYQDIDGDFLKIAFTSIGKNYWAASLGISIARQDTNTIDTLWNSSLTLNYRKETPLSKRSHLTTTISNFYNIHGYFKNFCDIHLLFENRWIKYKNKGNTFSYDPRIVLKLSAHYSNFFLKFKKK